MEIFAARPDHGWLKLGQELMSADIVDLSAGSIAQAISKKSISCKDVTTAFLERIDKLNPVLNAVCT